MHDTESLASTRYVKPEMLFLSAQFAAQVCLSAHFKAYNMGSGEIQTHEQTTRFLPSCRPICCHFHLCRLVGACHVVPPAWEPSGHVFPIGLGA